MAGVLSNFNKIFIRKVTINNILTILFQALLI